MQIKLIFRRKILHLGTRNRPSSLSIKTEKKTVCHHHLHYLLFHLPFIIIIIIIIIIVIIIIITVLLFGHIFWTFQKRLRHKHKKLAFQY